MCPASCFGLHVSYLLHGNSSTSSSSIIIFEHLVQQVWPRFVPAHRKTFYYVQATRLNVPLRQGCIAVEIRQKLHSPSTSSEQPVGIGVTCRLKVPPVSQVLSRSACFDAAFGRDCRPTICSAGGYSSRSTGSEKIETVTVVHDFFQ